MPGFGVKVTPKGRKVFIVLYRTGGAGSKLRKYTIIVMKASSEWDDKNPEGCMIGEYALLARMVPPNVTSSHAALGTVSKARPDLCPLVEVNRPLLLQRDKFGF